MEQNIKKERSLNRFFILFLAHAVLSFLCTTALWVCLLSASAYLGIVSPANTTEHAVSDWCASLDGQKTITPADIPAGAGYAFFDADGVLLETDLEKDALSDAEKLAAADHSANIRRNGSLISIRIDTDTQCVVVSYRLIASFRPPYLRRIFPNAELFFFLLLLFLLMADFLFIALRYARKLNRELQKLADAADQIRQQNLVFTPQKTGLSEFNRIMDSLDRLKTDLQHSLKEQWAMEQQKKRQFTALAHDIKTPLAIVTGNAELLSETEQSGEQREYTAFILDHARQIHRYVTGMLELTRTDALSCSADETTGSTLNESSLCPIQELLSAAAQDIENLRKKKHLSCSLQIKDLPGGLLVPKDKLQRILSNLIDNAVQYSPENGTVFLRASAAEGMLQLSIQDEGSGFSKEALTLAASEFYRADPGRSSKEHFGMGLSIASRIAGGLNGTLRLENAPGKGALVTVSLPVCRLHDSSLCPVTASK
jgi:signal transduction histidine kinase